MRALDAHGQATEQQSLNLAAALVVEAKREGISRIDRVALGDESSRVYIARHPASPLDALRFGSVDTVAALRTPAARSSALAAAIPTPSIASPVQVIQAPSTAPARAL